MHSSNKSIPTFIGVAGGSGSGKTTLANKLREAFDPRDVIILSHDHYYKSHTDLPFEERVKLNYDHPDAFDTALMVEHLHLLKEWQTIERPEYSFVEHTRLPQSVPVHPAKIIIVEGFMIFENRDLRELLDMKIYVDTDADVRFIRRLLRDVKDRGRSLDSVVNQYLTTVKPMHDQFVEPSKRYADIIVPEGGMNEVALSVLIDRINAIIQRNDLLPPQCCPAGK